MIPKTIHYCWFGRNPKPKLAEKCIQSWETYFPDHEIIEWNESNYDVNKIPYIAEAYRTGKFAFVSDYARFDILYQYGGIYFDTDVEVIKPFDDILANGAFMGCETDGDDSAGISVAPGLGIAAEANMPLYRDILDFYATQHFLFSDGSLNTETVVKKVTSLLLARGLQNTSGIQRVAGVSIYPKAYFNPLNNNTGVLNITDDTHSIHRYAMSWLSESIRRRAKITRVFHRLFGEHCFDWLKRDP